MVTITRLLTLLVLFSIVDSAHAQRRSVQLTPDGAWCWFSDPRAIVDQGVMYSGWMTADGSVQIGATDLPTLKTNITTIKEKFEKDDHDNPALLMLPDGRIAAFFSLHAKGDMHLRVTTRPRDITQWTEDRELGFGAAGKGTTYANPAMLSDEDNAIYLFWRGNDFKPTFSVSKDQLKTFSPPKTLIQRPGTNSDNRPYVKMWTDGKGRIDLVFTDGHPRNEPNNSLYFVRYEKGGFFKANGTRIGSMEDLPLDPAKCDMVYDGKTAGRAWIWDICEDNGRPVIVYTRLPSETDHRYHYARWNDLQWSDHEIAPAGKWFPSTPAGTREREPHYSGGIAIDPQHPTSVYASRESGGKAVVMQYSSDDLGKSWTAATTPFDTATSPSASQVRPFVVRGMPQEQPLVLWMEIDGHYIHYTDYKTRLMMGFPRVR